MASRAAKWKCILQQSTRSFDKDLQFGVPATAFHLTPSEDMSEYFWTEDSKTLDIAWLGGLKEEDGLKSLIDGYSRWIMELTDQNHVVFLITACCDDSDFKSAIVSSKRSPEGETPECRWEIYETSLEVSTPELKGLEFALCLRSESGIEETLAKADRVRVALCVDLISSKSIVMHRIKSNDSRKSYLNKHVQRLGVLLKCDSEESREEKSPLEFWEKELGGYIGLSDVQFPSLSCTRPSESSSSPSYIQANDALQLSWEQIDTLAEQYGLRSGVSVVRAAFAYTLSEYMETDRLILGDQNLRDMTEDEGLIKPVLVHVYPQDTSHDFLRRVDEFDRSTSAIPVLPPQNFREILKIPSSQTLYSALFSYKDTIFSEDSFEPSHDISRMLLEAPIELILHDSKERHPSCTLRSRALLMDSPHLQIFLKQIDSLLAAMFSAPTMQMRDLAQLFPKELLSIHSPTASEDVRSAPRLSPAHWVDHWASSNPSWIGLEIIDAISEDNTISRTWSYGELSQTSNQLCAWLLGRGWSNKSIAVCLDRSFMAYCLVLAIWKSGNCYVPVAEDLPEARQLFLLSDSGATAFFVDAKVSKSLLSPENCEVIDIASFEVSKYSEEPQGDPMVDPKPSDNCYLLYTSGSTGSPKGVLVSRGNLSAFTEAQSDYICRDVPDTPKLKGTGSYLAHASRAFDVHICEMVLGWRHGFRLVTGQRSMILDNLFLVLRGFKITHAGFVPSLLEHAGVSAESLPDLRYLGVGGEKISETIIERFVGKQSISLVNAYGPTEATIGFTSHTVKPWSTVRNIGTAVGNITIHVLESNSPQYTKRGQAGELCVTGDLVASGYHRRPDATGFTDHNGQRMYRTGDIVRLMANDCIEYLGRRDSQAKIRGQRLELEEVSIAIRRCAEFPINVASMVTPSPITKRPQLVSFFSPSCDRVDATSTQVNFMKDRYQEWVPRILQKCRVELPAYMVPSVLVPVSSIPIQISGKADNRRLVSLYESIPISELLLGHGANSDTEPPSESNLDASGETDLTENEKQVREIICSQIRTDPEAVTRTTSIFQLGIDSLGALGMATKLRHAGYICSAADVLGQATVSKLALLPRSNASLEPRNELAEKQKAKPLQRLAQLDQDFRNSQSKISNSSISIIRPCLPLQESIVSNTLGSSMPLYVNHIMCRLGKGIKLTDLKSAFEDLMQHNEILRTCFHVFNKKIVQVILKPRVVTLHWDEVVVSDENAAHGLFKMRQAGIASAIINRIEEDPPFHILAASSIHENDPGWIMLSIHHSIFDGASMGILLKQLYHHYTGNALIRAVDLSPLYEYMIADSIVGSDDFWSSHISGYSPGLIEDEGCHDGSYTIITKTLPAKLSSLSKIASTASSTTPIVVETVWAVLLAKFLGQKDVIFGRVINGRSIPVELVEEMLVPLVTTVPGRFRLPPQQSGLIELVKVHAHAILECLPHQHTPLRAIQRHTQASGPLFNSLISYLAIGARGPSDDMLSEMDSIMPADYPLALEIRADSDYDRITLRLRVSNGLSSIERFEILIEKISTMLHSLVSDGDVIIEAADPSVTHERKQHTWDETEWTETEKKIRRAVAEVTGLSDDQVSKNASFFAIGIDSVVSIHLARCLKQDNIDATPSDILRYPTIGALHNYLDKPRAISRQNQDFERPPRQDSGDELLHSDDSIVENYSCTPLQTAMIGQCLSSGGNEYLHHHVVTLNGPLDLENLLSAWRDTVENTDILRTSFHRQANNSQFNATVHKYPLVQWSHRRNVKSLPQAIEAISQETSYPNIESFHKPPWKITFLTGDSGQLMVVSMHHCLYDGFSLPLLFESLEKIYLGQEKHQSLFAPVARRITSSQDSSIRFWSEMVAGYKHSGMSLSEVSSQPDLRWAEIKIQTPVSELQRQCGMVNVTLQTVALLAFGCSLMPLVGQRDVVFGHVVSGRSFDIDDSMSVVGPLFNTVPFRLRLDSPQESIRSALQAIQRFSIDCQPFQHAPLSLVQREWRAEGNLNGNGSVSSLFDALFTFNKSTPISSESIFQPYKSSRQPDIPHYRLNVEFEQSVDYLIIRTVSRDVMTKGNELETWIQRLALAIEEMVSSFDAPVLDPSQGIRDLPLVASTQLKREAPAADSPVLKSYMDGLKLILSKITRTAPEHIHESNSVFALGLDSILALDVSSQCREGGLPISVGDILEGETIQGIAKLASKKLLELPGTMESSPVDKALTLDSLVSMDLRSRVLSLLSLSDDKVEAVIPCLSGQTFYIASWLRSQRRLWEFTFALKSRIRLDPNQIQEAWQQLQRRHSILRTSFAAILPTQVLQVVRKPFEAGQGSKVQIEKASGDLLLSIKESVESIGRTSSDLFIPPVRLQIVEHAESDVLLLTLHHALYDAKTISILIHDLDALYQGKHLDASSNFSSFVLDTRQKYHSGFSDDYWKETLALGQRTLIGAPYINETASFGVESSQAAFPRDVRLLEARCHEKGIAMPSLLILAVARSLARAVGVSHPTFGLFQNGRSNDYPGIQRLAGPTVNILPLVVQDALATPSQETLVAVQQILAQRSLYDQTELQSLREMMKELGRDIEFNLLVNILWGQLDDNLSSEENSIFSPLSVGAGINPDSPGSITGVTAVDKFDWMNFPECRSNYLEIGYDGSRDTLLWRLDYVPESISKQEAEEFLKTTEEEMNIILGFV